MTTPLQHVVHASPGNAYVAGCTCRGVLIDYVTRRVGHPYFACPFYATSTDLDAPPQAP